ncbi:hypothetical protein ACFL7M_16640 [Thermodesulfobacteriota bacterium]
MDIIKQAGFITDIVSPDTKQVFRVIDIFLGLFPVHYPPIIKPYLQIVFPAFVNTFRLNNGAIILQFDNILPCIAEFQKDFFRVLTEFRDGAVRIGGGCLTQLDGDAVLNASYNNVEQNTGSV